MYGKITDACAASVRLVSVFLLATSLCVAQGAAPDGLRPMKLSGADPKALAGADVKTEVSGGRVSKNRMLGLSSWETAGYTKFYVVYSHDKAQ